MIVTVKAIPPIHTIIGTNNSIMVPIRPPRLFPHSKSSMHKNPGIPKPA